MSLYTSFGLIILTVGIYLSVLGINEWLFVNTEVIRGINWVYLPAGVRLVCTLLFGGVGAIGIFLASLIATYHYYFPNDLVRALAGATSSALAPYLVYLLLGKRFNFHESLAELTPSVLLVCSLSYATANVVLHHAWLIGLFTVANPLQSAIAMFTGDMVGAFLVLYALKLLLASARLLRR
jgi:hypothetical protein